ncbi:MAG: HpcH/HpaI aldolase family protein [Candidatus Kariarchaeaceae archaeon]|jgi:4-hydroxy-2-oxoheptanedioate aldolase
MIDNSVRRLWDKKKEITNAWLAIPNSWTAEIIANIGFDALTIDMQHGLADFQTVLSMLQSISTTHSFPVVRVPWNDPAIIMRILDAGAMGIICPMINSKQEAESFVGASRYPPLGYRSLGPIRASLYSGKDYYIHANSQIITLAMIETVEAVNNIDEILSVKGLDGIYIGTMDLSLSLGIEDLGELANPLLRDAIDKIMACVKKHQLVAGMHARSIEDIKILQELGIMMITPINDSKLLQSSAELVYKQTKNELKHE